MDFGKKQKYHNIKLERNKKMANENMVQNLGLKLISQYLESNENSLLKNAPISVIFSKRNNTHPITIMKKVITMAGIFPIFFRNFKRKNWSARRLW